MKNSRPHFIFLSAVLALIAGLLTLSNISGFEFKGSRRIPWDAAVLLTPLGYIEYSARRLNSEESKFDFVFQKASKPRTDPANPFPWTKALMSYFILSSASGCLLMMLRRHSP